MTDKVDKIKGRLNQAKQVTEIGRTVAPPGVRGPIQTVEDGIEIADAGLSLFQRIKAALKKKKK